MAEKSASSAPDAVVADVAAAGGVVDGAAPKVAAPMAAAGGRYSGAVVAAMTEDQLRTAVSAGLLTSGQMTRALQQFGLEATALKGYQPALLKQALEGSSGPASSPNAQETVEEAVAADEAARVEAEVDGGPGSLRRLVQQQQPPHSEHGPWAERLEPVLG